ncbi:restriction endonuclease [Candidatus Woesearchaeota archaeon]|nr:restriction endonuclease [Candidatus Woesearchaeota archaeon]
MGKKNSLLIDKLKLIKRLYEEASRSRGTEGTLSEIRASKLIMPIHDYIKEELIAQGVNPNKIFPPLNKTKPEMKLIGFLKGKNQDIIVLPEDPQKETIKEGVLIGGIDKVGKRITNRILSINIRSQLSSIAKNFDTLYERTFAEPLNLHLKNKKLVMGEVYLVPLMAYDPDRRGNSQTIFREKLPAFKYISSFQALNNRKFDDEGNEYKYERVCLLIVDFRQDPPKIINDVMELVDEGFIDKEMAKKITLKGLTIKDFVSDILEVYRKRHGSIEPLK